MRFSRLNPVSKARSPRSEKRSQRISQRSDFAVKLVLREAVSEVKTLRVEDGYGYAEHHKDWLRLGCELVVEEDEAEDAYSFLAEPTNAGILDDRFEAATEEFLQRHLSITIFDELSCSFYLLEEPRTAS